MPPRNLIAGNWKMNGLAASRGELEGVIAGAGDARAEALICPPFTLITAFAETAAGSDVAIGGQDCHAAEKGAHTGDISAEMLADAGASCVILGHSERRADHGETDEAVRAKVEAAWRAGLTAILCVGETEAERDAGRAEEVVAGQLAGSLPHGATAANTVIAYEPVWAIGTGKVPSSEQIDEVHDFIRARLTHRFGYEPGNAIRLLYGGSVKPNNAPEIFASANVDGALVGGASLKAEDFSSIIKALEASV